MCGICGIIYFEKDKKPDKENLLAMRDSMVHRGPDDSGIFIDQNIGLGHRRLSIIDLEGGHQPMSNEDDSLWVILNGEIYNYVELRQRLIENGHKFKTKSDTEVILHLYEDNGIKCVDYLNGMFAFCLWDKRKEKLFLVRDHFGIKPLYYFIDHEKFIFASEIKAILKYPHRPKINYPALADYLTFQYVIGDKTLFDKIYKVLPGEYLEVSKNKIEKHTYWDIPMRIDSGKSEEYFKNELLRLLKDSVRIQLRSDVPVGSHLSGGIDTAVIVCLASAMLKSPIKTFTAGFREGGIYDDTKFARIAARYADTEHSEIFPEENDFIQMLKQLIWYLDEPAAAPGLFPQYFVSKLSSQNVKVVLGGQGADEMAGGYTRYYLLYLERLLLKSITGDGNESKMELADLLPRLSQLKNYIPLMANFWKEGLFEPLQQRYFRLILRQDNLNQLLNNEVIKELNGYSPFDSFSSVFNKHSQEELLDRVLYYETKAWLPALLHIEDRMSMANSLESRVPFLDKRICELLFSMPVEIKFKGGVTKYILRKAVKGLIPKETLNRQDKIGFPVPLHLWFKNNLSNYVKEVLLSKNSLNRGIFNKDAIYNSISADVEHNRALWGMLCIELWCQNFLD